MQITSLNVGMPTEHWWQGKIVRTGIVKQPTDARLAVGLTNLEGDGQGDLTVHGGRDKAVYAYDEAHYAFWRQTRPELSLPPGQFGENLTTRGLPDEQVRIGDQFRVGTAVLMAVQPRFPCFKLGLRFGDADMVRAFGQARRHGIYFRVLETGTVGRGDAITLLERSAYAVTIQQIVDTFYAEHKDPALVNALLDVPFLPGFLRKSFTRWRA